MKQNGVEPLKNHSNRFDNIPSTPLTVLKNDLCFVENNKGIMKAALLCRGYGVYLSNITRAQLEKVYSKH